MNFPEDLLNKIPQEAGRYLSCGEGWSELLFQTDLKLSYIDPDYQILQIKEKFGTLRYYFRSNKPELLRQIMRDIVAQAEIESSMICEACGGGTGKYKKKFNGSVKIRDLGRVQTLCDDCYLKRTS
jgi:hypothetical protein